MPPLLQRDLLAVDRRHACPEMEHDAVLLVQRADEVAHLGPSTRSSGRLSGATTWTSSPRARSDAATSSPMKLAPTTTARFACFARLR